MLISRVSTMLYWSSLVSAVLFSLAIYCHDRISFLTLIGFACATTFVTNAGVALGQILSVRKPTQSFALAFAALILHAFGDVPSPIITGYLKDYFAPDCVDRLSLSDSEDEAVHGASSVACRAQGDGQRWCMFLLSIWLFWGVVWFGTAWILSDHFSTRTRSPNLHDLRSGSRSRAIVKRSKLWQSLDT